MAFWGDAGGFLDDLDANDDGTGNSGEGGETSSSWEAGRDGLIFLIDATPNMFVKNPNDEVPFQKCLECARNVVMSKIISSDKDLMGIVFFGTKATKNSSDFANVYDFQELDLPDADRILQIEKLESDDGIRSFEDEYGFSNEFAMSDALWACSKMFASSSYKIAHKRILIFTNTDDPHKGDRELKKRAIRKAKDLSDLGIDIQLLHLKSEEEFDVSKFYQEILDEEDGFGLPDPAERFDELMTRVRMKQYKKRALTSMPFKLSDGISMGVSMYSLNRPQAKGTYVKVDSRSNEEVRCVTKYICRDTGQELLPTDIKFFQNFGGTKVAFEKEEVVQMKSLVEGGLKLIGFKPRKYLKDYHHIKSPSFLYPDENKVVGSRALFSCLLKRCEARDVMPICVFSRTNSQPRFVALLPQEEEIDEHGQQIKPPGFHVIYLPFSDDIRKVKIDEAPKANEEQIDKMKEIIDKLKFTYTPESFENPALQKFYRCLEAYALDRDEVEEFKDLTIPDVERIDRKAGQVISDFKELVFPKDYDIAPPKAAAKRSASSSNDGPSKKVKTEMVDVDMKDAATKGTLNKLTVPILKSFCQEQKLKAASQRKADLIAAINLHFSV